jgi:CRP-like cAMP-binding protein
MSGTRQSASSFSDHTCIIAHHVRNQLLRLLPPEVLARLSPRVRPISLKIREGLLAPDRPIEAVYFVESGWVSLVASLENGAQAEVGLTGREGMVGLPLIVGIDTPFVEAFVQADGSALTMEAGAFRDAMQEEPELRNLLFRYLEAMHSQTTPNGGLQRPSRSRATSRSLAAHGP